MTAGILDEIMLADDQLLLKKCLLQVLTQKFGVVKLIVEKGKLKFVTAELSYEAGQGGGVMSSAPPPAPLTSS